MTNVYNVTVQLHTVSYSMVSKIWAGYEFYGYSRGGPPIYRVVGDWNVPTVFTPIQCGRGCFYFGDDAIWVGLANQPGGGDGYLVQAGTDGFDVIQPPGGASISYDAWYEFLPSGPVTFSSCPVSAGDSVQDDIRDNSNVYSIYFNDYTKGNACSVTNSSFGMGTPYFAQFVTEHGNGYSLNKFTTLNWCCGTIYPRGTPTSVYTWYHTSDFNFYVMNNGCGDNIQTGSISSSNSWTQSFLTTCGT
jgi:hypothetical protein